MPKHEASPIRITAIEPSGRLYGSEYCLLDILRGTDAQRFRWSVITPGGGGFSQVLEQQGISCHTNLPAGLHRQSRLARARAYARLLFDVRRIGTDLLYVNQAGMLRAASAICRVLRIPGVCQVQTLEDAQWISRSRAGAGSMLAYICNSSFIAEHTLVETDRKCVLYQGIAQPPNYVAAPSQSPNTITLGLVGRISESKGHYLTIRAAELLRKSGLDFKVRVIGDGLTEQDTAKFKAAVAEAGLSELFEFRGYRSDLKTEFASIHLLLIPSIAEPLGRVLYDAAHFGLPVIAADSGGLGEICRLYGVGQKFSANNPESLARAIRQAATCLDAVRDDFRQRSAEMIHSLSMDSYLRVIEQLLTNAAARIPCAIRWQGNRVTAEP